MELILNACKSSQVEQINEYLFSDSDTVQSKKK